MRPLSSGKSKGKKVYIQNRPLCYYNNREKYLHKWRGKILVIDNYRNVDGEMLSLDVDMESVLDTLDHGVEVSRRKRGIVEKWRRSGRWILIVAVEECGDYWLVRHVGKIRATKQKTRLMRCE